MRHHRIAAATIVALTLAAGLAAQSAQAPAPVETRVRRFVNVGANDANQRLDWLEPPSQVFPLGAPSDNAFTVSYTHGGKPYALNDYFTRTDVLAFLILKDGKPVFERYLVGTGPTDRYLSMSVSKSIVSVLVGVAVDERKITSIDDPVVKYLPQFKMSEPWITREMRVRDLLIHNSGLREGAGDLMLWPEPNKFTRADIIAGLSHLKPVQSFRSHYAYDNLLYIVAGEVAAAAGDATYEQLVRREVFDAVGLKRCQVGEFDLEAV